MIKIHLLKKTFHLRDRFGRDYLKHHGIIYTKNLFKANVLVSKTSVFLSFKLARKFLFHKKFIVWTNEPRMDVVSKKFKDKNKVIMNVYSGDVFFHNLHFLGSYHNLFSLNLGIDLKSPPGVRLTAQKLQERKKFCIAVFKYREPTKSKLIINGTNIDLNARRQDLAIFLYKRKKADIAGGNWPDMVQIVESSGHGNNGNNGNNWWARKMDLLADYKFNLCFENTIHPYYCTEKIWHSIAGGCLPIYYGAGTAIYETFPENSFVDASRFASDEDLLHFLENISIEEHIRRYNTCLEVMHRSCNERINNPHLETDILDRFISNVRELANQ